MAKSNPSTMFLVTILLFFQAVPAGLFASNLRMACTADNDLYKVLLANGVEVRRYDTAAAAINNADDGDAVLVLAEGYPARTTQFSPGLYRQAANRKLRLYLEYPAEIPGISSGKVKHTKWERGVITSDAFGESLPPMSIVTLHDSYFLPVQAENPHIVIAKVAGYNSAVYGLKGTQTYPVLFELSDQVLIATTKLSQFVTGRFAPHRAWRMIWKGIFRWLLPNQEPLELSWRDSVFPNLSGDVKVTAADRSTAWMRGVEWYKNSRLLMHESWQQMFDENENYTGPLTDIHARDLPLGDGRFGIFECFGSDIRYDGSQKIFFSRRSDCSSEVSMAFALRGLSTHNTVDESIAANLQDFVYFNSPLQQGPRADPESPSYGYVGWSLRKASQGVYYADDNARVVLGSLAVSAAIRSERWNEAILKTILANFRTTGPLGFKPRRIEESDLQKNGWLYYWNLEHTHFAPHYQSWIWACYLWLYDKTGYKPLLERTKTGIANMMAAYPDNWHWTNGLQQERARMILPLAWLLRIEETSEHRQWLDKVVNDLLAFQDKSGAIREELGSIGHGSYGPPVSNQAYGTREATLMQANGDPVADMLYTSNFALFSLSEAAAATGDERIKAGAQKLADFLVKIQVRSQDHPELDGAWFRAFDFSKWEYWASNADLGWGAWATETGWTQGWITAMLILRDMNTNLWDFTSRIELGSTFDKIRKQMLPDSVVDKVYPNRPVIKKLGTIDCDLVETTSIVFNNQLYRFEYLRPGYKGNSIGDSYFRFIEHASANATPAFAHGYHLGSAFVEGDSVYVTAGQRQRIAHAENINNSDIDFCEFNGKLVINYSWGNQHGTEFLAEAVFDGTLEQFLKGWFEE